MKNNVSKDLTDYYSKRAQEYENIYNRPDKVRQQEQNFIAEYIKKSFRGKYVLELACGTGYWTKYLLVSAQKILAIDTSPEILKIASSRYFRYPSIQFLQSDAYDPPKSIPPYTGMMANFWFSHIPKRKIELFLKTIHTCMQSNAFILFVDNVYKGELGGGLIRKRGQLDTWKLRRLENGKKYTILKNYYSKTQLTNIFSRYSEKLEIYYLTNFWLVGYYLKK